MAHRHEPVPLVVAVDGDVGITERERASRIRIQKLRRPVAFGVVGVAVGAVEREAVAGLVVGLGLAGEAGGDELFGGVEREGARARPARSAK